MAVSDYKLHMISFQYQRNSGHCCIFGDGGNMWDKKAAAEYLDVVEAWCKERRAILAADDNDLDGSDLV